MKLVSIILRVFALAVPRSSLEAQAQMRVGFITLRVFALAAPRRMLEAQALMKKRLQYATCDCAGSAP